MATGAAPLYLTVLVLGIVHELGIVHLEEEITLLGSQECENLSTAGGHSNTFTTCNRRRPPCPVLQLRSRYVP
jgi:hypothetical protein